MKVNPAVELEENQRLDDSSKAKAAIEDLKKAVRQDETLMTVQWMDDRRMWGRYYAMVNRNVTYPYPGAANIIDPLSFKQGSKLQPLLMNLVVGGPKWVACRPTSRRSFDNKPNIEILMEGLLRGGGRYCMPDFEDQLAYGLENYCWSGKGLFMSHWDYQTRTVNYELRRDALPGRLGMLVIRPDMTAAEVQQLAKMQPQELQAMNGPAWMSWIGQQTQVMQPIIRADWPKVAPLIRKEVIRVLGLDMDEASDKEAADDVMDWLKSGTKEKGVSVQVRKVLRDCPNISAISPFDLIVPDGAMGDFTQVDRVTRKFYVSKQEAHQRAADGRWNKKQFELALEGGTKRDTSQGFISYDPWRQLSDRVVGRIEDTDIFEFRQTWALADMGRSVPGLVEFVWEPNSGAVMRSGPYKARHGQIPLVSIPQEYNHPAYNAPRGLPKVLEDAELYNTGILRHVLNNAQSSSCTMFSARRSQWLDPETITPMPNLVIEVEAQGDFAQIPMTTNTVALERTAQMLQTWPEELVGTMDIAATQNPRLFEPRTRFEVEQVSATQKSVIGKRGRLLLKRIGRLYDMTLSLFQQYGPEMMYVERTGASPLRIAQEDIVGECNVVPVAAVGEMDPAFRQAKARQRVQMAIEAQPFFVGVPDKAIDIPTLLEDAFNEDDPLAAKRGIIHLLPEQVQQNIQRLQEQAARSAKYADVAMRLMAGAPVGVDEMKEIINLTGQMASMKKLQPLVDTAEQAQQSINRAAALMNGAGVS